MKKMLLGVVLAFSCLLFSCNDNPSRMHNVVSNRRFGIKTGGWSIEI